MYTKFALKFIGFLTLGFLLFPAFTQIVYACDGDTPQDCNGTCIPANDLRNWSP
jgi:hypothetical protein